MPETVSAAYAKANLPKLLKDVQSGKSIVISRYKKPIAVISPARSPNSPRRSWEPEKTASGSSIPTPLIP